ncbi:hypothetical protein BKA62DRAFT_723634 [Auriculariales sp. MPI-PUGE-AT-0066]|nr:hypothetical protein BKA62DRAFT_723634 [Auriculariales sp. MPI-PUGE-AT-0066]
MLDVNGLRLRISPSVAAAVTAITVLLPPTYILLKRALRAHILFYHTSLPDIPTLGSPVPETQKKKHGTVVICGGSIAGLLAARVCVDHFARVIVVEPETSALADADAAHMQQRQQLGKREIVKDGVTYNTLTHNRSRVPQYTAVHGYQAFFTLFLRQLFPNFDQRARTRGIRVNRDDMHYFLNGRLCRYPHQELAKAGKPDIESIFCSRRALESLIRVLVKEDVPQIEYVNGTVTDLKLASDNRTIDAALVRPVGTNTKPTELACDLIIDCTGNTQAGLKWLTQYDPRVNYCTLEWPAPPHFEENLRKIDAGCYISADGSPKPVDLSQESVFIVWSPTSSDTDYRFFVGGRFEDGIVVFSAGGWDSEMPVNLDQLRTFAQAANQDRRVPKYIYEIFDLLEEVEDQGVAYEAKVRSCSRIPYESVSDILPSNFIAFGDSNMRVNPRAGEGVNKCAMGATTLDGVLRRLPLGPHDRAFGSTFFSLLGSRTQTIWDGARLIDYSFESTTPIRGETRDTGAFVRWYMKVAGRVAERDPAVGSVLWHGAEFLGPFFDILAPGVFLKVLWEAMFPTKIEPDEPYFL